MPLPNRLLRRLSNCLPAVLVVACNDQPESQTPPTRPEPPPPVSFAHEVRPLLARECFGCHGRAPLRNETGLRLDASEFAFDPLDADPASDRHALVPGDRARSVAWQVVQPSEAAAEVPAHHRELSLTDDERALLGRWIDEGARYEPHWAFEPLPESVAVPHAGDARARNEIDRFVTSRLARHGFEPSPPADPRALLRRLTLALTGLPPASDELREFEAALHRAEGDAGPRDQAYENIVSRLLASPACAEHLAALWLEAARYADPPGPHTDRPGSSWLYRDWVVATFNDNLPFDEFLTAQFAGDLTGDQNHIVATAFNRLPPLSDDLAAEPAEATAANAAARVRHLGSAVLGMRLHCAQCHDHSDDPIGTREFYALTAFFNSIPEHGLHQHPAIVPGPTQPLPTDEQLETLFTAQNNVRNLEHNVAAAVTGGEGEFQAWLADPHHAPVINDCAGIFEFDSRTKAVPNQALAATDGLVADGLEFTSGFSGGALRFDGDRGIAIPELLPVTQNDPWTFTLRLRVAEPQTAPRFLIGRATGPLAAPRGIELVLEGGHLVARIVRELPVNALAVRTAEPVIQPDHWTLVSCTYDGSSNSSGMRLFVDGREAASEILADSLWKPAIVPEDESLSLRLGGRPGASGFSDGAIDDLQLHARALTSLEAATLYDGRSLGFALAHHADHLDSLREFYFSSLHEPARAARGELAAARAAHTALEAGVLEVSVMRELPVPRPAHVLAGGRFEAPRTEQTLVGRGVPEALRAADFADAAIESRRDLARWITAKDHPLTARVFVNRLWKNFFGRGLVATERDFGLLGAAPTHPELLDWLARDFVAHGWDVKRLCKQIALSATFQQDATPSHASEARDPDSWLLSRGPAQPLPTPQVRDLVLHAAGLLDVGNRPSESEAVGGRFFRSLYLLHHHPSPLPLRSDPSRCRIDYTQAPPEPRKPALTERELLLASRALATLVLREATDAQSRLHALALRLHGRPMTPDEETEMLPLLEDASGSRDSDAPFLVQPASGDNTSRPDSAELAVWAEAVRRIIETQTLTR